jgi:transposase
MHHLVLEEYIQTIEAAEARRDRLTAQIAAMLPDWTLARVVAALQTMRGMALVNAATLIAELGNLSRFTNPRQLMAYLGLVPSEHSSGNSVARRLLSGCGVGGRLLPCGFAAAFGRRRRVAHNSTGFTTTNKLFR